MFGEIWFVLSSSVKAAPRCRSAQTELVSAIVKYSPVQSKRRHKTAQKPRGLGRTLICEGVQWEGRGAELGRDRRRELAAAAQQEKGRMEGGEQRPLVPTLHSQHCPALPARALPGACGFVGEGA